MGAVTHLIRPYWRRADGWAVASGWHESSSRSMLACSSNSCLRTRAIVGDCGDLLGLVGQVLDRVGGPLSSGYYASGQLPMG
jgi:hypothetical protein